MVIVNRIIAIYPHGLNKEFSLKFSVDSWVWQETPENDWRTHQLKCEYNSKKEDNSQNTTNDKKMTLALNNCKSNWLTNQNQ